MTPADTAANTSARTAHCRFAKQLAGGTCSFQPDDLAAYADDDWDVRISVGESPLEEAFYLSVTDPQATALPVRRVIEEYALNRERAAALEYDTFPELPFLQEELAQLWEDAGAGRLTLEVFVNNAPGGAIDLDRPADDYMGVCCYDDEAWDYRLLDLVFVPSYGAAEDGLPATVVQTWDRLFLLMLLRYHARQGATRLQGLLADDRLRARLQPTATAPEGGPGLLQEGLLELPDGGADAVLTAAGHDRLHQLDTEVYGFAAAYDRYAQVAAFPPGLGVPNGFDARVQMMAYDGVDVERAVVLGVLDTNADELFEDAWASSYDRREGLDLVRQALTRRTHFSMELLELWRELGEANA